MLLSISGQNVKIPSDLKAYVADKAANLAKYYHHLDRVLVTLCRGANGAAIARIVASGRRRHCFIAQETADTAYGSINRATRDLERQLSEANDRRSKKHNRTQAGGGLWNDDRLAQCPPGCEGGAYADGGRSRPRCH